MFAILLKQVISFGKVTAPLWRLPFTTVYGTAGTGLFSVQSREYSLFFGSGRFVKTDGTKQGTVVVLDNYQGNYMAPLNGLLIFNVDYPASEPDKGLWRSDGTPSGTYKISDHNGHFINGAAVMDDFLYFAKEALRISFIFRPERKQTGCNSGVAMGHQRKPIC